MLSDSRLSQLLFDLSNIPHVRRIRIHSRLPIVLPARITNGFIQLITDCRKPVIIVVHCNHPRELDHEGAAAISKLAENGITLLNQTVLLAGVNDSLPVLTELSERLFELRVLPYYLHLLDPVQGVRHFDVPAQRGQELVAGMQRLLPGYLVPRLVREIPGEESKTRIL